MPLTYTSTTPTLPTGTIDLTIDDDYEDDIFEEEENMSVDNNRRYPKEFDVNIRLHNSYVYWKGKPFYAMEPYKSSDFYPAVYGLRPEHSILKNGNIKIDSVSEVVDPNNPEFDPRPVTIGWTSTIIPKTMKTVYLMRKPQRSQRAGIHVNNCTCFDPWTNSPNDVSVMGVQSTMFASMLNLYENDLAKNIGFLQNRLKRSVALSKYFAIQSVNPDEDSKILFGVLFYKYFSVGVIHFDKMTFYRQKNLDPKVDEEVTEFLKINKIGE